MATSLYPHQPAELTPIERILDASTRVVAAHGFEGATIRLVAEEASRQQATRISPGRVQYYFPTKEALAEATSEYVLKELSARMDTAPLPDLDPLTVAGKRIVETFIEQPHLIKYLGRSIVDSGDVGRRMFFWLYELSMAQGESFEARGMFDDDFDRTWGALHPLILRLGAFLMADYLDELLGEPFATSTQIMRWEASVYRLIRQGQLSEGARSATSIQSLIDYLNDQFGGAIQVDHKDGFTYRVEVTKVGRTDALTGIREENQPSGSANQ